MTIEDILDFNKTYSYINCFIDFRKDDDFIKIENVVSVSLVCGFGDDVLFNESLHNEDWDNIFKDKWNGDGHYQVDIVYKTILDNHHYQVWSYHEIEDIEFRKMGDEELNYSNTIPFDWDDVL
jgi:hypothetical protein